MSERIKVLIYSDDRTVRSDIRLSLGRKVARDLPELEVVEVATGRAVTRALDASTDYGLVILDGEARPGGFGLAYQLKEEYAECPPIMLLVARRDDGWLAAWSRAESVVAYPVDPVRLPEQVAEVLRAVAV